MFLEITYSIIFTILIGSGLYAIYLSRFQHNHTTSDFISAKKHPFARVMWSMYSASVGAWVSVAPSQFASYAGILGLIMYAFSSALPILVVAFLSDKMPKVASLNDYIGKRYGKRSQMFIVILSILNMGVALIAEYTTIGSIFEDIVGSYSAPIMIAIGVITMTYTSVGGVGVSIITDQLLALMTMILLLITGIYISIYFRPALGELPYNLDINAAGFSSLLTFPLSMISSTVFSESMWQRVYASMDKRSLYLSSIISSFIVFIVILFYGLVGFFANWAGLITDATNPNTYFFHIFLDMKSWVVICAVVIAALMCQSAVDSMQNALAAAICTNLFPFKHVNYARLTVLLINIPAIGISLLMLPILNLFLLVNLLTTSCLIPLLIGLYYPLYTEWMFLTSCVMGIVGISALGMIESKSFLDGFYLAWFDNGYDYKYFLVAVGIPLLLSIVLLFGFKNVKNKFISSYLDIFSSRYSIIVILRF